MDDIRVVIRLIREVCELGGDAHGWRMHMLERLRELIGAQVALCFLHDLRCAPGQMQFQSFREVGTDPLFHQYVVRADVNDDPTTPAIVSLMGKTFTRTREQLCSDAAWYGSEHFNEVRRPVRSDHSLVSQVPVKQVNGFSHLGFGRALGDRPFDRRDRAAIHLFHTELAHLWETPSARSESSEDSLPPRLQQTLALLQHGLSEKQIAMRLGLSVHTVHDYVKGLHRRFGVHSAGELVASTVTHTQFRPQLLC